MSLEDLLKRVESCSGPDNALDIAIDIALFTPDEKHVSVMANAAGTKLVYARRGGGSDTFWASDHTLTAGSRETAAALLRALISQKEGVE